MENRDRDKLSRNKTGTEAGDVNRNVSENIGKSKSDSSAEFGQKIGRSENLNEPSRRTGVSDESGMRGDTGRSRGSESYGSESLNDLGSESSVDRGSMGSRRDKDTSEGRH